MYPSTRKDKKFMVEIPMESGRIKTVHFGQKGYSDYTIHKDDERKERYINRHRDKENWNDITHAGFWSRWILWNKKTLAASIADTNHHFALKIRYHK